MGLFKRNPFGHILFIKKWLIRILGTLSHRRFRGFNELNTQNDVLVPTFKLAGYNVWGATAMMLSEIRDLINDVI